MIHKEIARRRVLSIAAVSISALALSAPVASASPSKPRPWSKNRSQNGWPILKQPVNFKIEGSNQSVQLAGGDTAVILLYIARRVNYEIETLRSGDVKGHSSELTVTQPYESNHLSGTAIALRPALYPSGARGLLYPKELAIVRDILNQLDKTAYWGGDQSVPMESHFGITLSPGHAQLEKTAQKIRAWDERPGGPGAGATSAFLH
ncbi:hypothetical protein [Psychromicrobium sp. YIM B11713]|uniref:hypothetical protein n=1 Tax=Psychromicrobium sp. YIM B11713 TaxID=3145233 RepID=UPI00374EB16B